MMNNLGQFVLRMLAANFIMTKAVEHEVGLGLAEGAPYRIEGDYLVSVVIPALNEENYLPDLLTTICHQTYEPIEVIVCDSSSPESQEATERVCHEFNALYTYTPRGNISRARNVGAQYASGDILLFIDADCWLTHAYIERMVATLERGYILAHGIDPHLDGFWSQIYVLAMTFKPRDYTARGPAIWADYFWALGGYDEDYVPGYREDLALGHAVRDTYGIDSIWLDNHAIVGTSSRRERAMGGWQILPRRSWVNIRDGVLV